MIKKDFILYGLVGFLIIAGIYLIGVEYKEEQLSEYNESKQVALNWSTVNSTDTTCDKMQSNLIKLERESFDGRELITDAIYAKYLEFDC